MTKSFGAPCVSRAAAAPMSAAARRRAVQSVRQIQASTAAARVLLAVQPVLARAAGVVKIRRDGRAAQVAAARAIAAAASYTAMRMTSASQRPSSPRHGATRAQVLATVLRSRPVSAATVGAPAHATQRRVRSRSEGVRMAEGRRVVKAARVGESTDLIRTVVAAQCGGGKSGRDGSAAETRSGARCCP